MPDHVLSFARVCKYDLLRISSKSQDLVNLIYRGTVKVASLAQHFLENVGVGIRLHGVVQGHSGQQLFPEMYSLGYALQVEDIKRIISPLACNLSCPVIHVILFDLVDEGFLLWDDN